MFLADEIIYVFENADDLLRIPRLPVDLDAGMLKTIAENLPSFRRLSRAGVAPIDFAAGIPDLCVETTDAEAALSPWGMLCWERARDRLYSERLWDSPDSRIFYTKAFVKAAENRSPEEFRWLNERLDELSEYLESSTNPKRLDFKPLRGNPVPPSTHEFDAWAASPGWRVFCHFEKGQCVLDRLAPGLH